MSTENTALLTEIRDLLKQLIAQGKTSPAPSGGTADDPVIKFGRDKGKRLSETSRKNWEWIADQMQLRTRNDGSYWPDSVEMKAAAFRLLGRPPYTPPPVEGQSAPDATGSAYEEAARAEGEGRAQQEDSIPF